jgi:DNA transformation protein
LYYEEVFFGIVFKGRLYFKTDEQSRPKYHEREMKPFKPNSRQTLKNYYEVPADVVEDEEEILLWAKTAAKCRVG